MKDKLEIRIDYALSDFHLSGLSSRARFCVASAVFGKSFMVDPLLPDVIAPPPAKKALKFQVRFTAVSVRRLPTGAWCWKMDFAATEAGACMEKTK
jgi:hypothetical protein